MKSSTTLSPCQPLGQSGNANPPSSTTSGGISGTHSPKPLPTGPSHSTPLQLSPQPPLLSHPPLDPLPPPHPHSPTPWTCLPPPRSTGTFVMVSASTLDNSATFGM